MADARPRFRLAGPSCAVLQRLSDRLIALAHGLSYRMTTEPPIVRLTDLRLDRGGRSVLRGINLSVPRGSIVAVLGPSGSGKSTLLSALTGELAPAAGTVEVFGQQVPQDPRELL